MSKAGRPSFPLLVYHRCGTISSRYSLMFRNKWNQNRFKRIQNGAVCRWFNSFCVRYQICSIPFKLLDQFEKCSGLKMNYTKTEAMWIASSHNKTETPLALKWQKTVKALGLHFSYNNAESVQKNFYDNLRGIKSQIHL